MSDARSTISSFLSAVKLVLTLRCEQSTRLVADSMDRRLTRAERWAVRLHALGCWSCRRFKRQVAFLREAARRRAAEGEPDADRRTQRASDTLSPEARRRIEASLRSLGAQDHA